jgi:preprotein translocase subunit SecE
LWNKSIADTGSFEGFDRAHPPHTTLFILTAIYMQFIDYLRDTRAELRHVSWPTTKQTINYTIIVLLISIGTGIFLGVIDFGFAQVLKRFI